MKSSKNYIIVTTILFLVVNANALLPIEKTLSNPQGNSPHNVLKNAFEYSKDKVTLNDITRVELKCFQEVFSNNKDELFDSKVIVAKSIKEILISSPAPVPLVKEFPIALKFNEEMFSQNALNHMFDIIQVQSTQKEIKTNLTYSDGTISLSIRKYDLSTLTYRILGLENSSEQYGYCTPKPLNNMSYPRYCNDQVLGSCGSEISCNYYLTHASCDRVERKSLDDKSCIKVSWCNYYRYFDSPRGNIGMCTDFRNETVCEGDGVATPPWE